VQKKPTYQLTDVAKKNHSAGNRRLKHKAGSRTNIPARDNNEINLIMD